VDGADIAVVPSTYEEAFGLAALEPMAKGIPVIVSDRGGLPEIVAHEDTGLVVPAGDEGGLRAALDRLLADPAERRRMGEAGVLRPGWPSDVSRHAQGSAFTTCRRVGSQVGLLGANPGSPEMKLEIFDAKGLVHEGDQVVTSANTFPPGLAVGRIVADAAPESTALTARVMPYTDLESLRAVVVLAWPPDPTAATTTTTTLPPEDEETDATDTTGSPTEISDTTQVEG